MTKMGQKKTTKKPIKKKLPKLYALDNMFSQIVRGRANNTCEFCGAKEGKMENHHGVVHRRYRNTRFELDNCACVCVKCHWYLGDFPKINYEFFKKRIGEDRMEQLEIMARSGKKLDLERIREELKVKMEIPK